MPNNNDNYPMYCLVAEFDILGFRNIILKPPIGINLKHIVDSYEMYFSRNIYDSKSNLNFRSKYQLFSDTVVTYMEYMDSNAKFISKYEKRCFDFFRHLCIVMVNSIFAFQDNGFFANRISEFPIRGGISVGQIIAKNVHDYNPVIMGKPIIEAYEWEQSQNWLGLSINPKNISEIKKILSSQNQSNYWKKLIDNNILVKFDVPTKAGLVNTWVINYVPTSKADILLQEIDKALKKYNKPGSDSIYAKYYATRQFIEYIIKENKLIPDELLRNNFSNI